MIDGSAYAELEQNLIAAERELDRLSKELSDAKKTQKFAAGTEKGLVAKFTIKFLREGNKLALAEKLALDDPAYLQERQLMMDAWTIAQRVLDAHAQAMTSWETARSLLSMAKAQIMPAYNQTRSHQG